MSIGGLIKAVADDDEFTVGNPRFGIQAIGVLP